MKNRKLNLQLFAAEAVKGNKIVYLYRILKDAATENAVTLAFATEDELSISKDYDSTVTKDGSILTAGEEEIEKSGTTLLAVGDTMYDKLRAAMKNNDIVEIWEANLAEPVGDDGNKFKGRYFQGYLTEISFTSSAEEFVEVSGTFAINGTGAKGEVTVTAEQQEVANYVFADTTKTGA